MVKSTRVTVEIHLPEVLSLGPCDSLLVASSLETRRATNLSNTRVIGSKATFHCTQINELLKGLTGYSSWSLTKSGQADIKL